MFEQVLIGNDSAANVKLEFHFTAGIILSHILYELDGGLVVQLPILNYGS